MSTLAIIIFECLYLLLYVGLLFSTGTFLTYYPEPPLVAKATFLLVLFSGFFIPYFVKLLHIKLSGRHYLAGLVVLLFLYCFASGFHYSKTLRYHNFHSYTKTMTRQYDVTGPQHPDVFRIICLGGSTTFDGYPRELHTLLAERYPQRKIEVLNAGMYAFTTQDAIIQYLFSLKELKPDLIIYFEALNDIFPSFTMPPFSSAPFRKDYGHFYGLTANIRYPRTFERFLLEFLYADLWKPKLKPVFFNDFKSLDSFRRNLETLIEITRSQGTEIILSNQAHCFTDTEAVLYPGLQLNFLVDRDHYANTKSWYVGMELFNRTSAEIAAKHSVPFVDQQAVFQGKPDLFTPKDTVHMTPEGILLKAQLFCDKIIELGLLDENI